MNVSTPPFRMRACAQAELSGLTLNSAFTSRAREGSPTFTTGAPSGIIVGVNAFGSNARRA